MGILSLVPYVGIFAALGALAPTREAAALDITMFLQQVQGSNQTQIRFKMQRDGEPIWDQETLDKLWVTTEREAMIESGPPPSTGTQAPQPTTTK